MTFTGHVAKKVMTPKDLTTIDKLVKTRNRIAHGTQLEISEEEFEDFMGQLKSIANKFFKQFPDLHGEWEAKFAGYKHDDKDLPALMDRYEKWSASVIEVSSRGNSLFKLSFENMTGMKMIAIALF